MTRSNDHHGIAYREGGEARAVVTRPIGHAAVPTIPDPRLATCRQCGRPVTYRRRTYGPNGRAGGWTHIGDGLAQYRSWHR